MSNGSGMNTEDMTNVVLITEKNLMSPELNNDEIKELINRLMKVLASN